MLDEPEDADKGKEIVKEFHVVISEFNAELGKYYILGEEDDENYIKDLAIRLAALGPQKVVLKGIEFPEDQKSVKGTKEKIGILCYDSMSEKFSWYFHKKMPVSFHGTGDIFASVLTGAIMKGFTVEKAASLAADYVVESIKEKDIKRDLEKIKARY